MKAIDYRGYTIKPDYVGFMFYNTSEGVDCDWTGDGWRSNVGYAASVEDAKAQIDDLIYESSEPLSWKEKIATMIVALPAFGVMGYYIGMKVFEVYVTLFHR